MSVHLPSGIILSEDFELVDVTMRDGALGRYFPYSLDQLKKYLHLLEAVGIKYAEIGFIDGPGKWVDGKVDSPNYDITPELNELLHKESTLKLWSMIDSDNIDLETRHVHANKKSLVRLTADFDKKHLLEEKIGTCKEKNIPFSVNLKHAGNYELAQIQLMAELAEEHGASIFYIVDTSGTMIPSQVARITKQLKNSLSIDLGFHGHDSLGFAAANSLEAVREGCRYIDVSLCGIGAGGGNAITESFLLLMQGERCDWNKLIEAGSTLDIPLEYRKLQQRIFWGFIGCDTTTRKRLMNSSEAVVAKRAMEWKYGTVLSRGEYTTLRLLDRASPVVVKTAAGEGAEKLAKEIDFLELNKSTFQYSFLPDIFSHEITKKYAYYSMPYLQGLLLRDYIYSELDLSLCNQSLEKAITNLNTLHHKSGTIKSAVFTKESYFNRLQRRWEGLKSISSRSDHEASYSTASISSSDVRSIFSSIAQGSTLTIDGRTISFSFEQLVDSLISLGQILEAPQSSIRLIHGDPHAGNILLHDKEAVLLDPNGFLDGGDIAYDFGKLLISFDWHDLSILDMLEPAIVRVTSRGIEVTNNKSYKDIRIEERHGVLKQKVMTLLNKKVVPLHEGSDPMLMQRVKLLLYIHQFSFAPTLIKERPQTALHILLNAISDYTTLVEELNSKE